MNYMGFWWRVPTADIDTIIRKQDVYVAYYRFWLLEISYTCN